MKNRLLQIRSVLVMESILRLRRTSTLVLFLVMCGAAFMLMPQAGSGGTMFLIGQRRVLLNSAATALTSAIMGGMVFSLAGFYLISNSITRDVRTGVGRLVAATPVSSARYLAGKLVGNMLYLAVMATVFMIACMGMHLLRGEMPLEPLVFLNTFGIMFLPMIPSVAAIALMFECVPFLSGRVGDVLYFFFWTASLSLTAALISDSQGHTWLLSADVTGIGFFIKEVTTIVGAKDISLGYSTFNTVLPPVFFPGLKWIPEAVIARLASALYVLPMFGIAWAAFRRFDPARRSSRKKSSPGMLARLQETIVYKWLRTPHGGWPVGSTSLAKAVALDTRMTLALSPILFVVIALSFVFNLFASIETIRTAYLPIMFFVLVPSLASISTRDRAGNTTRLIFSAPHVRRQFVFLKFFSALLLAMLVGFIPLIRIGLDNFFWLVALLNGMLFMAATATLLGVLTNTPKSFTAIFLLYMYISVNSKNAAAFDFAGYQMIATPSIIGAFAAASVLMIAAAWGVDRWKMESDEK